MSSEVIRTPSFRQDPLLNIGILFSLAVPLFLVIGRGYADGAMCLVSLLFLIRSLKNKNWAWIKTPWYMVAVVTWAYMFVSACFAKYDQHEAFKAAFYWMRFPIFSMAFATWILPVERTRRYLLPSLAILLMACSLDTVVQFITGHSLTGHPKPNMPGRLTGPFSRMLIGTFETRLIWPTIGLACMWAFTKIEDKKRLLLPLLLMIVAGFTILISGERAALALFAISGFVFMLFAKNLRKILFPLTGIAAIIAVAMVMCIPILRSRLVTETLPVIENTKASPYGAVWHNGYVAWQSSPIVGVGMKNFVPMCEKLGFSAGFRNELPQWTELRCVRHPHNPYLEWLAELGVIGCVLFIGLIISWGRHIKQNMPVFNQDMPRYYAQLGFAVGLIAFLWPFMASLSFFSNWSATLFWWVLGLALSYFPAYQNSQK